MAIFDVSGTVLCDQTPSASFTDAQCTTAFVDFMAKKCTQFGMSGTTYVNPSGLTYNSASTPQDGMKLAVAVSSCAKALDVWSTKNRAFSVKGSHARTLNITNNVVELYGALDNNGYKFLGGKGGSLYGNGYERANILLVDIDDKTVAISVMATGQTSYNNIVNSTKELCDMLSASLNGQTPTAGSNLTALVSAGGGYAACLVPNVPGAYLNFALPSELLSKEHSIYGNQTASRKPASTTKTMTMLCALEFLKDPFETVQIKTVDISSGSGSTFYDGDVLNIMDALKIMMMESSNTLANTIARYTGQKILTYGLS